jgi:hypothetical protein
LVFWVLIACSIVDGHQCFSEKHPASIFRFIVWRVWMQLDYIHRLQGSFDPWDGKGERIQFRPMGARNVRNMATQLPSFVYIYYIIYRLEGCRLNCK